MDIVIPLGRGSQHQDIELRYCLRGIEKHVIDAENIFIVGEKPDFVRDIVHIPAVDAPGMANKEQNIFRKIMAACADKRVSDEFLFFNDDHFLLAPWDPATFHYKRSLQESLSSRKVQDAYYRTLHNTIAFLRGGNNFDTHCPILYNKERFRRTVGTAPWYQPYGFAIKSLYCHLNGIEGSRYPDCKISRPYCLEELREKIVERPYFSVADNGITPAFLELLDTLYPEPSRYEA